MPSRPEHPCPVAACGKAFLTASALTYHVTHRHPAYCPHHARPLVCPACQGRQGGAATGGDKARAARLNAQMRWDRVKARLRAEEPP